MPVYGEHTLRIFSRNTEAIELVVLNIASRTFRQYSQYIHMEGTGLVLMSVKLYKNIESPNII